MSIYELSVNWIEYTTNTTHIKSTKVDKGDSADSFRQIGQTFGRKKVSPVKPCQYNWTCVDAHTQRSLYL